MYSKSSIAAFAASLLVAQVGATGSTIIKNQCGNNVYLWTVSNTPGNMQTIAPGDTFTEGYQTNPDGGGISMKLSTSPNLSGSITQFEYTLTSDFWYDISNINGSPFTASGLTVIPSTSTCRSLLCPAGVELCTAAYNQPDDNEATAMCDTESNMTLLLCSGQTDNVPVADTVAAVVPHKEAAKVASTPTAAAAPAVTAAPVAAPVAAVASTEAGGNVVTTFVTKVFTVTARDAAPSAEAQMAKRHHRHHFQRREADSN